MTRRPYHAPTILDLAHLGLQANGRLRLRVAGASMAPLLREGDAVWVEPAAVTELRRGDVLVVRLAGDFVTHRLVGVDAQGWHTKGDNAAMPDPPFAPEAILGRVSAAERRGRTIDFRHPSWRLRNRALGWLGHWEVRLARLRGRSPASPPARPGVWARGVGACCRRLGRLLMAAPWMDPAAQS